MEVDNDSSDDSTKTCTTCLSYIKSYKSNDSLDSLIDNIDINSNKRKIRHSECDNSDFICSQCGVGIVYIDDSHMYEYDQLYLLNNAFTKKYIVKNPYAYEKEPNIWLIFCRRMCEIKYNEALK